MRSVPNKNGTFSTHRHYRSLVRSYLDLHQSTAYFRDGARVSIALVVLQSIIVSPNSEDCVFSSSCEVFSLFCDCQSVELSFIRSVNLPNDLAIKFLPVGNLPVGSSRQQLVLLRMEHDLFE